MHDRTRDTTDKDLAEGGDLPADSEKTNAWMAAERGRELRARDMKPPTPEQEVARLERISVRSSMRGLPDFDPQRELDLENFRIRNDPEAYLKTLDGAGLDYATEHEVKKALEAK